MKEIIRDRANEIAISLVIFCLCLIFFNHVTDDYASFMGSLAARQYSSFAYYDVHFQGYIGIREVYRLLYYLMPRINWNFVFMIGYEITTLYLVLRTLRKVILKNVNSMFLIRFIQVFAGLFYIENIVFVSHTRVSLIYCGIALFNLLFTTDIRKRDMLFNSFVFIFGMLLRPESSIGMLLLVGAGYLIYTFDLIKLLKRIWLPIMAVTVFLTIFILDLSSTDIYVRKVEPEIEYKMMARRVVDMEQMKTARDSVKYEAALAGMWFDVREITPEFMRSIILPGIDLSKAHIKAVFLHVAQFYGDYPFLWCNIIVLLLLGVILLPDRLSRVTKIVVFELSTFAIIYLLDYNGFLVNNRHFMSLQVMALLISYFYFFDAPRFKNITYRWALMSAVLLFLSASLVVTVVKYKEESCVVDQSVNAMIKTMKKLEHQYTNRIIAVTIDARFLFDQHFSLLNEIYTGNTYIMFDWFTFPLTPRYVNYVSGQCNCDAKDPAAFFKWLSDNNALYIVAAGRRELTQRYLKTVDGCNVEFGQPVKVNSLAGVQNWYTENTEITTVKVVGN